MVPLCGLSWVLGLIPGPGTQEAITWLLFKFFPLSLLEHQSSGRSQVIMDS